MRQPQVFDFPGGAPPDRLTAMLISNPNSGRGGDEAVREALDKLVQSGINVINVESESARQAEQEIHARRHDIDLVILAGGDGTVSSSASALYRFHLPFTVFPLGTANDLARSLGLPGDIRDVCEAIVHNHRRPVDLAAVNGHYFFNAAHIGLGARVNRELTPGLKKKLGAFGYLKAAVSVLSGKRSFPVEIIVDGRRYETRSIEVAVGNGRYYGGGNVVDEQSDIDNGKLCLYSLAPQPLWKLATLAPLLRGGRQHRTRRAFRVAGNSIEINSGEPMEVYADGEPATVTPARFEIMPRALEVIAPPADQ